MGIVSRRKTGRTPAQIARRDAALVRLAHAVGWDPDNMELLADLLEERKRLGRSPEAESLVHSALSVMR